MAMQVKHFRCVFLLPLVLMLGGCNMVLLNPSGYVARQQIDVMIITTLILASIIVPVLVAIAVVAWHFRATNTQARYDPKWDHSPQIELLVWAWPLLIIIAVGAISWIGTHQLDPYRPLTHYDKNHPVPGNVEPLQVNVVSLQWKWLFFYPQYGIATVNELAAPVNRPIQFKLTSSTMMDSFFVPALAGQIYTMPGMQTQLHGVINKLGTYKGFSANYSGAGFTDMRFSFHGMTTQDFKHWVARVRTKGGDLDRSLYDQLVQPSRADPVRYYAHFTPGLYTRILNRCVDPGKMCMNQMMAADAHDSDPPMSMPSRPSMSMHGQSDTAGAPAGHAGQPTGAHDATH